MAIPVADLTTPEQREFIRALVERRLTAEEFQAYVDSPMDDREREETEDLIRWFRRRYATPRERLEYARRTYAQWMRSAPQEAGPLPRAAPR